MKRKRLIIGLLSVFMIVVAFIFTTSVISADEYNKRVNSDRYDTTETYIVGRVNYKGINQFGQYIYEVRAEVSNGGENILGVRSWDVAVYNNSGKSTTYFTGVLNNGSLPASHYQNVYIGQFAVNNTLTTCYVCMHNNYVYLQDTGLWLSLYNYNAPVTTN